MTVPDHVVAVLRPAERVIGFDGVYHRQTGNVIRRVTGQFGRTKTVVIGARMTCGAEITVDTHPEWAYAWTSFRHLPDDVHGEPCHECFPLPVIVEVAYPSDPAGWAAADREREMAEGYIERVTS